jgi:predicted N-formylglutamate amidohydrolase
LDLILTCEHAGNEIPEEYAGYFEKAGEVLNTHRGYDPGASDLFTHLSRLASFSQPYMISRLLIEPNRSLHHPQLFSEFSKDLPEEKKDELIEEFYLPYRHFIESKIENMISTGGKLLHLSVHTFTPELDGGVRDADVGLLFDPERREEKDFCNIFQKCLFQQDRELRVRFNYPYLGVDDGFTTFLRDRFPQQYLGIELEVNQKYVEDNKMEKRLKNVIFEALSEAVQMSG